MATEKRLICDPHHHLWKPSTHSWQSQTEILKIFIGGILGDTIDKYGTYEIEQFINESKKYKLVKSVYLECGFDDPSTTEVKAVQAIADKYGFPHGIIGHAILQSDDIEQVLKEQMKSPNFRGIRPAIAFHSKYPLRCFAPNDEILMDPKFHNGLKVMAKNKLIFDCHIYPQQLKYISLIAAAYPALRIVINHCAYPVVDNLQDLVVWQDGIRLISKYNNVFIKLSGWVIADRKFNKDTMKYLAKIIIESFGVDRCMFASNFPVDKPYGEYDMYWDIYIQILQELQYNEKDIDKMVHKNAIRVYKLDSNL
eukprot:353710_1